MEGHLKKKVPEIDNFKKYGAMLLEEKNINPFWNDVFKAYGSLNDAYIPLTPEELLAEPIFFNKKFKIDKKAIFFPEWTVAGVYAVGALVKTDGSFKSLNEFKTEFNMNTKMLDYFGCLNVIKRFARKYSINIKSNQSKKTTKGGQPFDGCSERCKTNL